MPGEADLRARFVSLLKKSLLNDLHVENDAVLLAMLEASVTGAPIDLNRLVKLRRSGSFETIERAKAEGDVIVFSRPQADRTWQPVDLRELNHLWHVMMGRKRLDNLERCIESVLADGIPGDLIETGVWRGGGTIFMRGMLAAHGVTDRAVWVADSFAGFPPPSLPEDAGTDFSVARRDEAVSLDEVQALFERYGLLDAQVHFLKGWFRDTLPSAPIERLAVLRLDGDLYESTMDALNPLYDKISPGGYVIVDDYFSCPPCAHAVRDFRRQRGVTDEMLVIDGHSLYWRKS
ncbi:MAG TPA: TylF/MycF/NovP-related O-methyltransferase [Candidatus Sulfotelmatobacter sp.]|nr:TylF/MycF/NovP-related O-methyltransferase [Candidatus Sulfotelmatobacter sp.]